MSDDEVAVSLIAGLLAAVAWGGWYVPLAVVGRWTPGRPGRRRLALTPPACALAVYVVLRTLASADVVDDPFYIAMYLVLGMAWVGAARLAAPLLGVGYRADVLERNNP